MTRFKSVNNISVIIINLLVVPLQFVRVKTNLVVLGATKKILGGSFSLNFFIY